MKNTGLILSVCLLIWGTILTCNAQVTEQNEIKEVISPDKVEVYYFHFSRRCATCQAVEDESEKALKDLYPEKVKSGEVIFLSVNLEEESNDALAEDLKISGQTLISRKI